MLAEQSQLTAAERRRLRLQREEQEESEQARWRSDPVAFAKECFGFEPWELQALVLLAVVEHHRVAVRSGHKVGKSSLQALLAYWWAVCIPGGCVVSKRKKRKMGLVLYSGEVVVVSWTHRAYNNCFDETVADTADLCKELLSKFADCVALHIEPSSPKAPFSSYVRVLVQSGRNPDDLAEEIRAVVATHVEARGMDVYVEVEASARKQTPASDWPLVGP